MGVVARGVYHLRTSKFDLLIRLSSASTLPTVDVVLVFPSQRVPGLGT
jgi:hypothetical protein